MGTLWEARQGLGSPNRSTAQRVRFSSPPSRRLLAPLQTDTQTHPSRTVGSSQADAERCRHTDPRGSKRAQRARADRPLGAASAAFHDAPSSSPAAPAVPRASPAQTSAMPWHEAPRAPGPLLEAAGHLQLCRLSTRAGGTRQLPRTEPLIIHLSLMGSERSRARRLLEEPSGFYCRPKAEGRAGCRDRIRDAFLS